MIVVADIGGTKTRIAASVDGNTFGEPIVSDTIADDFDAAVAGIADAARAAAGGAGIDLFVAGIAGRFSEDRRTLLGAAHLPGWAKKNTAEIFEKALGAPALLENDTALGALGEANAGAGIGANVVGYIAVGTGIGGRKVVDGRLDEATRGEEIGHRTITIDGVTKEFEVFVSGTTVMKEHGVLPSKLDDPVAWDNYARAFAYGLHDAIVEWKPERIVLGGRLCAEPRLSLARIEAHLKELTPVFPELCYASLPFPGLTGALAYAKQMRPT